MVEPRGLCASLARRAWTGAARGLARRALGPGSAGGWAALGLALALAGVGLWTVGTALAGRHLPAGAQPVQISLPLEPGRYRVVHGGSRPLINRHLLVCDPSRPLHAAYRGQAYAMDIVATGRWGLPGRGARPQPRDPRAHAIFGGARVRAPCTGRVVQARGDRPDMPVPQPDRSLLEGNHVLLDCGGGVWLLLAHLAQGSVGVAAGERVVRGAPVGRVGNSGNSTLPHLHLHAQRPGTADRPLSGGPLWLAIDGRLPVRGMRMQGKPIWPR